MIARFRGSRRRGGGGRGACWTAPALVVGLALAVSGCGEMKNTIVPTASSFDSLTVLMPTSPNANYVGIYEAQSRGFFRQAALNVHLEAPKSASTDTLTPLYNDAGDVALSDEPSVFLARNQSHALVAVGAVRNRPLTTVEAVHHRAHGKHQATVSYRTVPDNSLLPSELHGQGGLPTYDGLTIVVLKSTIVENGQLIRRFVQAVARGYEAAVADPQSAVNTVIAADPQLARSRTLVLKQLQNAESSFTPPTGRPWGWQQQAEWNRFGTWLYHRRLITNTNAITDASTNELLAGEGV